MRSKTRTGLLAGVALAVAISIPAAAEARTLYGTTGNGKLVTFNDKQTKVKIKQTATVDPDAKPVKAAKAVQVAATRSIFGLPAGVRLVGIDFRSLTGELFGIGSDSTMYRILITGDRAALALPAGSLPAALSGTHYGVDFNPNVDRIRVVSNAAQNLRLNPNANTAGTTGSAMTPATAQPSAVDAALNPGTPSVVAAAYTNSALSPGVASSTTLYVIDQGLDTLNIQSPANAGTLTAPVPLSIQVGNDVGFDIAGAANVAYVTNTGSKATGLYRLDLSTGQMKKVGDVGTVNKKGQVKRTTLTGLAAVQD